MLFQQVVSRIRGAIALSALPLTLIAVVPPKAQAATFSLQSIDQLYVFGDSLSDTGNVFAATGGAFPQSPPNFQGRFSNGPLWVEYLADDLGLVRNPNTNFAYVGATTGSTNIVNNSIPGLNPPLPGVQQEINNFTATHPSADPNGLYIIWAGANDYLYTGVTNPTGPVTNLSNAVTSLAGVGAKNFLVVNLPNLGQLPATYNTANSVPLNAVTAAHNTALAASLNNLRQTLPNDNIISFDVNSLVNRVQANPAQFGFTNATDACLVGSTPCSNPNQYVFWNDVHPTTAAYKIVGDSAFSTLQAQSVPEPSSAVGILAFGALGVGKMLSRKKKAG